VKPSPSRLLASLLVLLSPIAFAAQPPEYLRVDLSTHTLIERDAARKMWSEAIPPSLLKLYPIKQWGFASEVNGGFDDQKNCVVTARAMILPRRGQVLVLAPKHTSVSFGAFPGASQEQCREFASTKLHEAIVSVMSSLTSK
jgi:hypothetical protein